MTVVSAGGRRRLKERHAQQSAEVDAAALDAAAGRGPRWPLGTTSWLGRSPEQAVCPMEPARLAHLVEQPSSLRNLVLFRFGLGAGSIYLSSLLSTQRRTFSR